MGGHNVIHRCFELLLLATVSVLLGICQQTPAACPLQCPNNCTDQDECCPTGYYLPAGNSSNETHSSELPLRCVRIPCSDEINYCEVCRFNWTTEEVVCSQCEDRLEPSPRGDSCDPPTVQSTLNVWLIPVVVVVAVIVASAVAGVVVVVVVRRCRHTTRVRPPLPRPDQLDDLPGGRDAVKSRQSIINRVRNRYAQTPNRPQQSREDVLQGPDSASSPTSVTSQKSRRPAAALPAVTQQRSRTKKPTTPVIPGPAQEIYVNSPEDGEIYANEVIELQSTVVVAADDDDVQEEYQNVDEIGRTASQRTPSNDDEQQIYQNVVRKPKLAPKPKRTF